MQVSAKADVEIHASTIATQTRKRRSIDSNSRSRPNRGMSPQTARSVICAATDTSGAESASCFPRTHLTGSAVDSRRHLAREGALPAWAETFLKVSGSSMELEPGPEDALIVVLRCSRNEIVNL
jgi:hypothetical protein